MKILHVSPTGFGDPRFYRSNELTVCASLAKLGHEVTIFCTDKHPKWQLLEERHVRAKVEFIDGFTVRRFPSGPEIGIIPMTPTLLMEILRFDCDVIHTHDVSVPASFYSALASRMRKKPLIVTQHAYRYWASGMKLFAYMMHNNSFGRFTLHSANAVIGLSTEAVRFVQGLGADATKTMFVPNGVDTGMFRPDNPRLLRDRWGIEGPVVLFVGRLDMNKGVDILLRAFSEITSIVPEASMVIIGRGPEEFHLRELQRKLKLENVFFLGRVPREEMPYIYPGCRVLVLPTRTYEIFGNVVLEAMASGVPVIGSKLGGMIDIISHGATGFHIMSGDQTRLFEYLKLLLTNEELRSEMSRTARDWTIKAVDEMVIGKRVESIYRHCLEDSIAFSTKRWRDNPLAQVPQ